MSEFEEDLSAYIDGELPPERVKAMEDALAKDPALRSLEQRLRRSIEAVEAMPLPQTSSPALRRAVLAAIDQPTFFERWFTLPRLLPIGLVAAAGVSAGTSRVTAWTARWRRDARSPFVFAPAATASRSDTPEPSGAQTTSA